VEADELGSDTWKLEPVIELLKQGAVGVIPTDTVYVCCLLDCYIYKHQWKFCGFLVGFLNCMELLVCFFSRDLLN